MATLLEHDAEPNLVDINGNTALHLASCIPAFSTAMLLLEHEANVNAQNKVSRGSISDNMVVAPTCSRSNMVVAPSCTMIGQVELSLCWLHQKCQTQLF